MRLLSLLELESYIGFRDTNTAIAHVQTRNHQLPKDCLQGFGLDHLTRVRFIFATCCAQFFLGRAQISLRLI